MDYFYGQLNEKILEVTKGEKGDKGDGYVFCSPEQFGAAGDGSTDDTIAFQKCIDYAKKNRMNVVGRSCYYKITSKLIVDMTKIKSFIIPGTINTYVPQKETFLFDGGDSGVENCNIELHIQGAQFQGQGSKQYNGGFSFPSGIQLSEYDSVYGNYVQIGCIIRNISYSSINISAKSIQYGIRIYSDKVGVAFNKFYLGYFRDNTIHLDFYVDPTKGGYINSNQFYGGDFTTSSSNPDKDKNIYIRIGAGSSYTDNSNNFYDTGLQGAGIPIYIMNGNNNNFVNVRAEIDTTYGPGYVMNVVNGYNNNLTTTYLYSQPSIVGSGKLYNDANTIWLENYDKCQTVYKWNYDKDDLIYTRYHDDDPYTMYTKGICSFYYDYNGMIPSSDHMEVSDPYIPNNTNGYDFGLPVYTNHMIGYYFKCNGTQKIWVNAKGSSNLKYAFRFFDNNGEDISNSVSSGVKSMTYNPVSYRTNLGLFTTEDFGLNKMFISWSSSNINSVGIFVFNSLDNTGDISLSGEHLDSIEVRTIDFNSSNSSMIPYSNQIEECYVSEPYEFVEIVTPNDYVGRVIDYRPSELYEDELGSKYYYMNAIYAEDFINPVQGEYVWNLAKTYTSRSYPSAEGVPF